MNQDLNILHLVLNASIVVQAVMLLLVLIFMPRGLFGRKTADRV